jgi:capsular exopolysaccharide synthesis family protein
MEYSPLSASATPSAPTAGVTSLEIQEILRILRERYRIILACLALGLALMATHSLLSKPRYRATALLQYDPMATEPLEASRTMVLRNAGMNQEMLATQVGLLRSDALAIRVAQAMNLAADPAYGGTTGNREVRIRRAAQHVKAATQVEAIKDSLLLRLSVSAGNPVLSAKLTAATAREFIASSLERRFNSSAYARKFLSDQLARTKQALEQSERRMNDYAIRAKLFRRPGQAVEGRTGEGVTLSAVDLGALQDALNQARVRRIAAETAWQAKATDRVASNAAAIGPLVQQRAQLQAQYAQNLKLFKPAYPAMQELQTQIAKLDDQIREERTSGRSEGDRELEAAYRAAERAEHDLTERFNAAKMEVQGERSRSIEFNILQREADTNRSQYDALLQRLKEVTVAGGIGRSNIALVDDPSVPQSPYKPNWGINLTIGLAIGLVFGFIAAFIANLLLDTVVVGADVRSKLGLRMLGAVPLDRDGLDVGEALTNRKSSIAEAYYSALTGLKFARPGGMPRTISITSSFPGEGKSTTAYALAASTARLGLHVLLVDADLRRPTFRVAGGGGGLADLLASDRPATAFVTPMSLENLSLIPAGNVTDSAAELLSSARLPVIVAELRDQFDLIVVDGPPVLGLTDAPLLASVVDATVVVIESGKTRTVNVGNTLRRIVEAGGDVLGVILTKVRPRDVESDGYDYYDYGMTSRGSGARFTPVPDDAGRTPRD